MNEMGIERLLIANRGEIARRIIRTCGQLGIATVAVYSDADVGAAFVADADIAVALGGETPAESYLRADAIIDAALRTGADAVHPGYGFLAENAGFARAVIGAGLTWVGPGPEAIDAMGSKLEAKARMADAGVPLLGSADLTGMSAEQASAAADDIGYPILIKASAGGGGRGMRIVDGPDALLDAVAGAAREAESAFGDGTIYAERYVSPSRHVEVQIFGDSSGRVVHFGERECSIQRRHQKIVEEAPSTSLDDETRAALHAAAVRAGEAIGYTNAGTVEFLLGGTARGAAAADAGPLEFYFLEVNTRLQVEHPVTEEVFGVDLVRLQLEVAAGGAVPDQSTIGTPSGHAIEARLYAEDPTADYRPSTGPVRSFVVPDVGGGAVRLESAIDSGSTGEVSRFYDPMMAKVIVHGPTRDAAARRLANALASTVIDGIATNRELLVRTLRHPEFLDGRGDSDFLVRNDPASLGRPLLEGDDLAVAALAGALAIQAANRSTDGHTAGVSTGFRNVVTDPQRVVLAAGETDLEVDYLFRRDRLERVAVDGVDLGRPELHLVSSSEVDLAVDGLRRRFTVIGTGPTSGPTEGQPATVSVVGPTGGVTLRVVPRFEVPTGDGDVGSTVATMPGTVVTVEVAPGDRVVEGDVLVVLEAMKMELAVAATVAGVVTLVPVAAGDGVDAGAVLVVVEPDETDPTS